LDLRSCAASPRVGIGPNAAAFSFRTCQNALDFASHGFEQKNRVLAAYNVFSFIKRYVAPV
jgi:hypothetical protein